MKKRKCRQVNKKIICVNDQNIQVSIDLSVRNEMVTIDIRHGASGGWAHISKRQAIQLADWLDKATAEITKRELS